MQFFFKKSAICIIWVSFLAGCQFSGRDKLSRYPGASATLQKIRDTKKGQVSTRFFIKAVK